MTRANRAVAARSKVPLRPRMAPLAAALALCFSGGAHAATIAVNDTTEDSIDGKCTLIDAVAAINTATAVSGCAAGDGNADTIDLSFFTSATSIVFASPHSTDLVSAIAFSKPASIIGPLGSDGKPLVTIQRSSTSGFNFRVIGTSADLTVDGVNVNGGQAAARGGGIYAGGYANLTISDSVISGNSVTQQDYSSGGGVASAHGNITLENSTVSDNYAVKNGGGIYCKLDGTVTLTNSTVSNNSAYESGGGIYSFNGNVALVSSTVSGNSVGANAQGNARGFYGGGIYVYRAVFMTNSTVANNSAFVSGGAIYAATPFYGRPGHTRHLRPFFSSTVAHPTGAVYMYFSTVADNSVSSYGYLGGVVATSYMRMVGSVLSNNAPGNVFAAHNSPPGFTGNNNIIFGDQPFSKPADTLNCDPMLAPLGDYGGPTQTMPLYEGSCAIDAGGTAPDGLTLDQRGLPRVVGDFIDVGAVEKQGPDDPLPDPIFSNGFE